MQDTLKTFRFTKTLIKYWKNMYVKESIKK